VITTRFLGSVARRGALGPPSSQTETRRGPHGGSANEGAATTAAPSGIRRLCMPGLHEGFGWSETNRAMFLEAKKNEDLYPLFSFLRHCS
jgi:hypothetical protein